MGFHDYVRIALCLPLVAFSGQARFSDASHGCGGGHGTVTRGGASRAWITAGSRPGHAMDFVNACTRPHSTHRLPLMCEREPLAGRGVQREFACKGSLLILRRALRPAVTS